ncbi:MAG: hypothetical protein ACI3YK_02030 [Eubacteriales bacterium]
MKKTTLLLLLLPLLACLLLVSCDDAATPVQPGGSSGTASVGETDAPVTSSERTSELTTEPTPTTTYPVLYTRPEIAETHPDVVPVEPIESFEKVNSIYEMEKTVESSYDFTKEFAEECFCYYAYALVTPLEIYSPFDIRVAVDCIYEQKRVDSGHGHEAELFDFPDEVTAYYSSNYVKDNKPVWLYTDSQIPITTTGGKYIAFIGVFLHESCVYPYYGSVEEPHFVLLPLTWELDMANVANGDAIAKTNRPPFIGYAETYYLFGYGDVYEELMKEG